MSSSKEVHLDTNVVLRIIIGDIALQRDKALALVTAARGQCQVADIVFVELEYALRQHYKLSRDEVAQLLKAFSGHPKIGCNRLWLDSVLQSYASHSALSFTDIALAEYAEHVEGVLYTFDKKLAQQTQSAALVP